MAECDLYKERVYIRRYDDLWALDLHVQKRICKTPVADRFPPQAHDLECGYKVSRHIDRIVRGNDRAICGLI